MAHTVREVRQRTVLDDADLVEDASADGEIASPRETTVSVVARVIYLVGSIIMGILTLRFILMLLGANRGNGIVDFIYDLSRPFAAPFFGMFNYDAQVGRSRFEFETLIAILVYGLLTWALIQVVALADRRTV